MAKLLNKIDISDIDVGFKEIRAWYDDNFHPDRLDLDDADVYKNVYHKGKWAGVFQCVCEGTLVTMLDGTTKPIEEVEIDDEVLSVEQDTLDFADGFVDDTFFRGMQECIELTFDDDTTIVLTEDHWLLTDNGWRQAGDLQEHDNIVSLD